MANPLWRHHQFVSAERTPNAMSYQWESIPRYGLKEDILEGFLLQQFGDEGFFITIQNDFWWFCVPRHLSPDERETLASLRFTSSALSPRDNLAATRRPNIRQGRPEREHPPEPLQVEDPHIETHNENHAATSATNSHCKMCILVYLLWFSVAASSLAIGFWRSLATADEGKGFTDAAYVVAVGGLVVFPIQARHNQRCRGMVRDGG